MDELKKQLNKLWSGVIENINFDYLKGSFFLKIKVIEDGVVSNFDVCFNEVSAYYYVRDIGENRLTYFQFEEGDYLELTSIDYYENGIGEIVIKSTVENWTNQFFSSANFVLEIWNSMLFIEAKKVTINDYLYSLK